MKYLKLVMLVFLCVVANLSAEDANINTKLKLGFIVPLSGPLAFFGTDIQHAVDLAIEADPSITQNIEILWEDSQYDSKQAVSVFNKLVNLDRVDIIYSFGGPMLSALAPLAETKEVPFFATESEVKDCERRKYCSLFRNSADEWGQAFWQVARERKYKNIGIVKNENQFMNTFVDGIVRTKPKDSNLEILIDVLPDTTDLRTEFLKIKNTEVDAIGLFLLPGSYRGFLNAVKMNKKEYKFLGVDQLLHKDNNIGFSELVNESVALTPTVAESFKQTFESKYGASAGMFYAAAGYDFVNLLNETTIKDPDLRKLDLVKALHFTGIRIGQGGSCKVKKAKNGVTYYSYPIAVNEVHDSVGRVIKEITF